jgi:hypothetical protein
LASNLMYCTVYRYCRSNLSVFYNVKRFRVLQFSSVRQDSRFGGLGLGLWGKVVGFGIRYRSRFQIQFPIQFCSSTCVLSCSGVITVTQLSTSLSLLPSINFDERYHCYTLMRMSDIFVLVFRSMRTLPAATSIHLRQHSLICNNQINVTSDRCPKV